MFARHNHAPQDQFFLRFCAICETCLIIAGLLAMCWLLPRRIFVDGDVRLYAMLDLINHGKVSRVGYSFVGPLFSIPFLLLGNIYQNVFWWSGQYNKIVLAAGILATYLLLKDRIDRSLLRKFFLILIVASMFGDNVTFFGGEPFTAMCVGVGILAVAMGPAVWGWSAVILGVVNTPASLVAMGCIVIQRMLQKKRVRYMLALLVAVGLILAESWIRRGNPFDGGYGNQKFSTPFFIGLASILFSFGKGIVFFAPGLLLPVRATILALKDKQKEALYAAYTLWIGFIVGLVLIYASWWAWDGAWFWGPRFFLFASIPASFALAVRLSRPGASLLLNLFTLLVLGLSLWVGINGAIFDLANLWRFCTVNNYADMYKCQYVPNFSVLWYPIGKSWRLDHHQLAYIAYSCIVALYVAFPLLKTILRQCISLLQSFAQAVLNLRSWQV